jgi:lysophospholipase L1-like esterase
LPTAVPGPVTIVTLGDSLTEGQGDTLELGGYPGRILPRIQALRSGSSLLNVGHSGWNSDNLINGIDPMPSELDQALAQINQAQANGQAAIVCVWIGSNDLWYLYEYDVGSDAGDAADLQHYTANLDTILSQLRGAVRRW